MNHKTLFKVCALAASMLTALLLGELTFFLLEAKEKKQTRFVGAQWMDDVKWGWKPTPGQYRHQTPEFVAQGTINRNFMNDREENSEREGGKIRILVLGDSHTFATGVSTADSWAKQLETMLNTQGNASFRTYNGGVTGYSMHQYVARLRDDGTRLQPHFVVVGVSYATDFYDLLPPGKGGWIYGGDRERDYYDFDETGQLNLKHWKKPPTDPTAGGASHIRKDAGQNLRAWLEKTATFRHLRRSRLFLILGSKIRLGGQSLWPNMEIVMEKEVSPEHEYQHRLFRALLAELKKQADKLSAKLVIVGIPYLPQVYEDLQRQTFSGSRYDPWAMNFRVAGYCKEAGVEFVDTQTPLREKHRALGRWLHFPKDAHPTQEGHEVIAEAVVKSGSVNPAEAAVQK